MKSSKDILSDIVTSGEMGVAVFSASWCGPCRMFAPVFRGVAHKMEGQMKLVSIDVDEYEDLRTKYNVRSVPTVIMFAAGKIKSRIEGAFPNEELFQEWIQDNA